MIYLTQQVCVTRKTEASGFETANYADVAFSYLIRILAASIC